MKALIIEDHPIFIRGLMDLLISVDQKMEVDTAQSVDIAVSAIDQDAYDIIFLDLNMPGLDGLSFIKIMKKKKNFAPVAIVSSCDDEQTIEKVIAEGAVGFIPKSYNPEQMSQAIKHILAGDIYLPEAVQRRMNVNSDNLGAEQSLLAQRCKDLGIRAKPHQVLRFVSEGYTNKQIAEELNISVHTVKAHLAGLFSKLSTSNRVDTVMEAKRLGIL